MNRAALRVLDALRANGSVTPRSFRAPTVDGGDEMDRLAARVNELRDAGHNIDTVMERSPSGKRYARYFLRGEPAASGVTSTPTEPSGADGNPPEVAPETADQAATLFDLPAIFSPWEDAA